MMMSQIPPLLTFTFEEVSIHPGRRDRRPLPPIPVCEGQFAETFIGDFRYFLIG